MEPWGHWTYLECILQSAYWTFLAHRFVSLDRVIDFPDLWSYVWRNRTAPVCGPFLALRAPVLQILWPLSCLTMSLYVTDIQHCYQKSVVCNCELSVSIENLPYFIELFSGLSAHSSVLDNCLIHNVSTVYSDLHFRSIGRRLDPSANLRTHA